MNYNGENSAQILTGTDTTIHILHLELAERGKPRQEDVRLSNYEGEVLRSTCIWWDVPLQDTNLKAKTGCCDPEENEKGILGIDKCMIESQEKFGQHVLGNPIWFLVLVQTCLGQHHSLTHNPQGIPFQPKYVSVFVMKIWNQVRDAKL